MYHSHSLHPQAPVPFQIVPSCSQNTEGLPPSTLVIMQPDDIMRSEQPETKQPNHKTHFNHSPLSLLLEPAVAVHRGRNSLFNCLVGNMANLTSSINNTALRYVVAFTIGDAKMRLHSREVWGPQHQANVPRLLLSL
jgi:hypothetical protein